MKKTIKILFTIAVAYIIMTLSSTVNAATASITASKTSVTVGESVKATVTINAASWNIKVSGSATDSIVGYNADGENQKTTKTYTIDTSKAGTYKVSINGDVTDASDAVNKIDNQSVSITVKEKKATTNTETTTPTTPAKKSSNANLSTLGVTPKQYDFTGFKKNVTEYSVTIPSDVDSLKVLCKTEDSKATYKVTGNSGFEVGSNNSINIVVTAEDGTTKTYKIKVTKLAKDEEKPGNVIDDNSKGEIYLTKLQINGIELSPEFKKDTYFYNATLNEDKSEVEIEAEANNSRAKIEISGNTDLKDGENTITILLTMNGETERKVYQITLNKELIEEKNTVSSSEDDKSGGIERYIIVGILLIVFIIIVITVLIILIKIETRKEKMALKKNRANKINDNGLYNQDDEQEDYRKTIEEINAQTQSIFNKDEEIEEGQSVEYDSNDDIQKGKDKRKGRH